jgi:pyruvate, orthophosphate dikinase
VSAPDNLELLQLLTFKGRADVAALAGATGRDEAALGSQLDALAANGMLASTELGYALEPKGAAWRDELIASERSALPPEAISELYPRFARYNAQLKEVVTAWQLRSGPDGELTPNDHADLEYDDRVRERLGRVDDVFRPLLDKFVELVPRWASYVARFDTAMANVDGGDNRYIASPLLDSYHTVWFEFHEELFKAQGLDRRTEEAT